jgi:endonuclease/exonuclease/phosphatase (EEP) superfamily protein YafD
MIRSVLILVLAACSSSAPVAVTSLASAPATLPLPARTPATLRVLSYNLNFGLAGDRDGVAAIARANADVVVLQETNAAWEQAILAGLPGYPHHRFDPPADWPAGGMGVLSRFPIVSVEQIASVAGPFFAWRIVIDAPGGRVQILDVHLHPPISDGGSWVVGFWSTRERRARELAWHLAKLDPALPAIVAGDFNEELDGRALRHAIDLGFTDAIAQFAGARRTWEWPVGRLTLRFQLDHVLYDSRFVAVAGGIVEAGRSDHRPVWADLQRTAD